MQQDLGAGSFWQSWRDETGAKMDSSHSRRERIGPEKGLLLELCKAEVRFLSEDDNLPYMHRHGTLQFMRRDKDTQ